MPVSFELGILPNRPVADCVRMARQAEELGYGGVWVADSHSVHILDAIAVACTPAESVARFQKLVDLGIEGFVWPANMTDHYPYIETFAEQVVPKITAPIDVTRSQRLEQ